MKVTKFKMKERYHRCLLYIIKILSFWALLTEPKTKNLSHFILLLLYGLLGNILSRIDPSGSVLLDVSIVAFPIRWVTKALWVGTQDAFPLAGSLAREWLPQLETNALAPAMWPLNIAGTATHLFIVCATSHRASPVSFLSGWNEILRLKALRVDTQDDRVFLGR